MMPLHASCVDTVWVCIAYPHSAARTQEDRAVAVVAKGAPLIEKNMDHHAVTEMVITDQTVVSLVL
jgi:hypothetical protein